MNDEPSRAYEKDCPFCAIVAGQAPADVVAEGEAWIAISPLEPATVGHTLVISREHVRDFTELAGGSGAELLDACATVGRAAATSLGMEGLNLITSAGGAAEQTVFHLHFHVVPRTHHDAIDAIWPAKGVEKDQQRKAIASLRKAMSDSL